MNRLSMMMCGLALVCAGMAVQGCKTNEPGVRSTYRSQYTTVAGTTTRVTEVAEDVLEDLKLQRVDSKATAVDGFATGYTADNKKITVEIKKAGNETSEVRVNVGAMGDPELGKDIIARMQEKLG